MSTESLKRVLTRIKATAHEMRKQKYAARLAPKPAASTPAAEKPKADDSTTEQIRELLAKG